MKKDEKNRMTYFEAFRNFHRTNWPGYSSVQIRPLADSTLYLVLSKHQSIPRVISASQHF